MGTFNSRVRTAAQWAAANPIMPVGMIGFESDTGRKNLMTGATASGSVNSEIPAATTFLNLLGYCSVGGTSSVIGFTLFPSYVSSGT